MEGIICTPQEMEKLASMTLHPSSRQRLQNSQCNSQSNHSLLDWVMAAVHMVWANVEDVPETVSKWQSYGELVQVL